MNKATANDDRDDFNTIFQESDSQIKKSWRKLETSLTDEKLPRYLRLNSELDLPKRVASGQLASGGVRTVKRQRQSAPFDVSS